MSAPILSCHDLTAGYDNVAAVRNLDLQVGAGEVVALLGPNGSGKTTTLLTLAGVLAPITGTAEFLGRPVVGRRPHLLARRGLTLVPDDRSIFFQLTTRENIRLARSGDPLDVVLRYFPALRDRLDVRAGLLSGGEQQMLAVGRALARRPKALLVDEMSMGLAPVIVQRLLPVVRMAADELDVAVLLVEQHVDLALQYADRAYVLNHGHVVHSGDATALRGDRALLEASYLGAGAMRDPAAPVSAGPAATERSQL
jgi:branched-chain amino acid transport system ATP-binding protein